MKPVKSIGEQVAEFLHRQRDLADGVTTSAKLADKINTYRISGDVTAGRQKIDQLIEAGNRIPKFIGPLAAAMGTTVDDMLVTAGLAPRSLARQPGAVKQAQAQSTLLPEEQVVLEAFRDAHPAVRAAVVTAARAVAGGAASGAIEAGERARQSAKHGRKPLGAKNLPRK